MGLGLGLGLGLEHATDETALVQIATVQSRTRVAKMRMPYTPHLGRSVVQAVGPKHLTKHLKAHTIIHAAHKGAPVASTTQTVSRPEQVVYRG